MQVRSANSQTIIKNTTMRNLSKQAHCGDMLIPKKLFDENSNGKVVDSYRKMHLVRGDWNEYSHISDAIYLVDDTTLWSSGKFNTRPDQPYISIYGNNQRVIEYISCAFDDSVSFRVSVIGNNLFTARPKTIFTHVSTVRRDKLLRMLHDPNLVSSISLFEIDNPDLELSHVINMYNLLSDDFPIDHRFNLSVYAKNDIHTLKRLNVV